jgi:hypothetical protein
MKDITFGTVIYNNIDDVPEVLPFSKCMLRYENKSPKDSEFWGHVSTKQEMLHLFDTSLRCKSNKGSKYCIREWKELGSEYRCFWNNKLVAISAETDDEPDIQKILDYIRTIRNRIFYNRCVFDIAIERTTGNFIFVEYNSWETNSGAHRFDWVEDTTTFYDSLGIVIRWNNGETVINEIISNDDFIRFNNFEQINLENLEIPKQNG